MTGMEMLLKNALTAVFKAMGVTGEEIVQKFEELKTAIPAFAAQAQARLESIDTRQLNVELELKLLHMKMDAILKIDSDPHTLPAGTGAATQAELAMANRDKLFVNNGLDNPHAPVGTDHHFTNGHAEQEDGTWIATNGGIHDLGLAEWMSRKDENSGA